MDPLFPALPEDLSDLSDDELAQLQADSQAAVQRIRENDTEFLGDRTAKQVIDEMQAGVEGIERLAAAQTARAQEMQNFNDEVAKLAEKAEQVAPVAETDPVEETETTEEAVETEHVAEEAAEPVAEETVDEPVEAEVELPIAASAKVRRPLPAPSRRHKPVVDRAGAVVTASAGIHGTDEGAELDRLALAEAMISKRERSVATPQGVKEDVVVASIEYPFPEELRLDRRDSGPGNEAKIKSVVGEEALAAAGGLCAPRTPFYEVPTLAVADRPARAALPSFNAARGGINVPAPLNIGDVTGVGRITAAQDAAGGSPATKACQTITCSAYTQTDVAAIYHCIRFGNLGARAWPELVASFSETVLAAHARLAETAILDGIAAGSTAVTGAAVNGAVNTLVGHILEAAAGIRSHYRLRDGAILRAMFPAWVKDLLVLDIVRSQFQRFAYERDGVEALFRMFDIEASFFLDGETGSGQVFGAQSGGALLAFPTSLIWYLFPEGTWVHLDSGTLELGIVRDSSLNATNDYEVFGETWENVAKIGSVSYKITSTVCPNGAVAAPGTALTC